MIARDIDHPRPALGALHQPEDDIIVRGRPVEALFQPPAVDDVSNEVDGLAVGMVEKVDQHPRVAAARAQMDVADPDRPVPRTPAGRWPVPPRNRCRIAQNRFLRNILASEGPYRRIV